MILSNDQVFLAAERSAMAGAGGKFARQIFIISLQEPNSNENQAFVAKVLAAAQLNLEQDTLLSEIPAGEPRAIAPDIRELRPQFVLVFGIPAAQIGLSVQITPYQPLEYYGVRWLFADPLSVLAPDKNKKTQLWAALQKMFLTS